MNLQQVQQLLQKHGQEQLLAYYNELSSQEQQILLDEIAKIDFSIIDKIHGEKHQQVGTLSPIDVLTQKDIAENEAVFRPIGLEAIRQNKVAAVLLAGGQGTRLGFDGPKGTFNIGVTRTLSIFEQQFNNIKDVTEEAGCYFPVFIMTSTVNNDQTVAFFKENNYFGYPAEKVHFFIQEMAPCCDFNGKILLADKGHVAQSPNGNGGWYISLKNALADVIAKEGIEWLNVYAVDNVLQRICDPTFIGATFAKGVVCSGKVVKKANAEERVGVLCKEDGRPCVVEYYECPAYEKNLTDENGELVYAYGVILNYLFNVQELEETAGKNTLYHFAEKKIPCYQNGEYVTPTTPNGYKFETLVVDQIKHMASCLGYEVAREKEFAPVKNPDGVDSVVSARELLVKNGVQI